MPQDTPDTFNNIELALRSLGEAMPTAIPPGVLVYVWNLTQGDDHDTLTVEVGTAGLSCSFDSAAFTYVRPHQRDGAWVMTSMQAMHGW